MAPKQAAGPGRASATRGAGDSSRDRFDAVPARGRVGAHRIVAKPKRFWIYLVSALIGITVLTGAGVAWVAVTGANLTNVFEQQRQSDPTPPPPSVQPELDPSAAVVVLNGTVMPGFAAIVDGLITSNEWGTILFSGEAASNEVQASAVFYAAPEDEAFALGLAERLGGLPIFQSGDYADYGARFAVVLGADYSGPGSDQFIAPEPSEAAE